MKVMEESPGVFLRLVLENKQEYSRYVEAYQHACYSGLKVQQTVSDLQSDGSYLVGIWVDERLVGLLRASIETGDSLEDLIAQERAPSLPPPQPLP